MYKQLLYVATLATLGLPTGRAAEITVRYDDYLDLESGETATAVECTLSGDCGSYDLRVRWSRRGDPATWLHFTTTLEHVTTADAYDLVGREDLEHYPWELGPYGYLWGTLLLWTQDEAPYKLTLVDETPEAATLAYEELVPAGFELDAACPEDQQANHGQYMRCVTHATADAVEEGTLTREERWRLLRDSARRN